MRQHRKSRWIWGFGPRKTGADGKAAMEKLGGGYPALSGCYPVPKPVMVSWILAVQQLCGVYSPFYGGGQL